MTSFLRWSGRLDLNQRPSAPEADALPDCATSRNFYLLAWITKRNPAISRVCLFSNFKNVKNRWKKKERRMSIAYVYLGVRSENL